jgi:exopolyphosphatase/guanosine-5'-triphosphate,3'-diphosphate pyrophosphatase
MTVQKRDTQAPGATARAQDAIRLAAVIDIGTNSIRMAIAELHPDGTVRHLENLSQEVNLGKDTFTKGGIRKATIEECVRVLKTYRRFLDEYGITRDDQIRVVATSAVREADNRLAFVDRIAIATGFNVDPIDEAEVNRVTYLDIQPFLRGDPVLADARAIVTEVGGGSTELLLVKSGNVALSRTYKLGSLRLRETLEAFRTPTVKARRIMEGQIRLVVDQITQEVRVEDRVEMITLGGDMRFTASQLIDGWSPDRLGRIPVADLEPFMEKVLARSVNKLVQEYHLTFPEAETLGPALLAYVELARALKLAHVFVTSVNLRDGLLKEMASRGAWTEDFKQQIIRSALSLGRKYDFDEAHARHVATLATQLFDALQSEHRLEPRYKLILYVAALLHEIGLYVGTASHHKHSMYLILHSELFGLSRQDVLLVALTARYIRRASPKPGHQGYGTLNRFDRIAVAKLAAMLRVADALDHSHSSRITDFQTIVEPNRFVIAIPGVDDLALEQLALDQKGPLFEDIFGMKVLLRTQQG